MTYENQGTAYDPGAFGYELQGRAKAPAREHSPAANENAPERERHGEDAVYASGGVVSNFDPYIIGDRPQPFPAFLAPRIGSWIATYTGKAVYPMDLRPSDIAIEDIAHSLAMQCRFNGHCLRYYSVAEHCVLVSRWLDEHHGSEAALSGLLHDAAEAYLCDVPRPLKPFLLGYRQAEAKAEEVIAQVFSVSATMHPEVKEADNRILFDEKAQNMGPCEQEWDFEMEPLGVRLQFWTPEQAEAEFLAEYWRLIETRRM